MLLQLLKEITKLNIENKSYKMDSHTQVTNFLRHYLTYL